MLRPDLKTKLIDNFLTIRFLQSSGSSKLMFSRCAVSKTSVIYRAFEQEVVCSFFDPAFVSQTIFVATNFTKMIVKLVMAAGDSESSKWQPSAHRCLIVQGLIHYLNHAHIMCRPRTKDIKMFEMKKENSISW